MPLHGDVSAVDIPDSHLLYHAICYHGDDGDGFCADLLPDSGALHTFRATDAGDDRLYVAVFHIDTRTSE